jgi:hypothetical protein
MSSSEKLSQIRECLNAGRETRTEHISISPPDAQCTWLLTELDPDGGLTFGLCDLGMGEPELGYVSLLELTAVRGKLGLPVERDLHFQADKTISAYADEARTHGHILT